MSSTYGEPYYTGERWRVISGGVSISLASRNDKTAGEHIDYDPRCASCWLGHAHSGNYHRTMLANLSPHA